MSDTATILFVQEAVGYAFHKSIPKAVLFFLIGELCDVPMDYIGIEEQGHEFKCAAQPGQCPRSELCPKYRHIDFDNGCFQRILYGSDAVAKALDIRKNGERPFNLLKKREGLEQVRVRIKMRSIFFC